MACDIRIARKSRFAREILIGPSPMGRNSETAAAVEWVFAKEIIRAADKLMPSALMNWSGNGTFRSFLMAEAGICQKVGSHRSFTMKLAR